METPCLDFLGDAPGQHRVPAAVLAAREDRLALQPEALDRGGGGGGGDQGWAHLGAGVGDGLAGAVVEVDRVDGAVDGGARVAAGAGAGDQGPGRGPGAVTAAPGHRGPRHHVAGPGPARG